MNKNVQVNLFIAGVAEVITGVMIAHDLAGATFRLIDGIEHSYTWTAIQHITAA